MNSRLISAEEKARNRRRLNRRKELKRRARVRIRLLSQVENQLGMLALLEANLLPSETVLALAYGGTDKVRAAVREVQILIGLAEISPSVDVPAELKSPVLVLPERVLQLSRRGVPPSMNALIEAYLHGVRLADAYRRAVPLPGEYGTLALLPASALGDAFPGIRVPKRLCRGTYLLRWHIGDASGPPQLHFFSLKGVALFQYPLPPGFEPQEREKVGATRCMLQESCGLS